MFGLHVTRRYDAPTVRALTSWLFTATASVATRAGDAQDVDLTALQDEAVAWLQEYLRLDTQNPPGNEILGARFFARDLRAEGIPYEIAESAPGRGNIWARLDGGDEPALVLLHHMDVVPADTSYWSVDPLAGEKKDGYIYGPGRPGHQDPAASWTWPRSWRCTAPA